MSITETDIRALTSSRSYEKGEDYYDANCVSTIEKRGNLLMAQVEGSSYEPYEVTVNVDEHHILSAHCTCPYDAGGICKHIVAVLLTYARQAPQIPERPSAEALLENVSADDVRAVLLQLMQSDPHLLDRVETILATIAAQSATTTSRAVHAGKSARQTPLPEANPAAFRKQVQQALRHAGYGEYYNAGIDLYNSVSPLIRQAQPFVEAGDGGSALKILEAIIEPLIGEWYDYDQEGETAAAFEEAGAVLTEAMLSADLSEQERKQWRKRLRTWDAELSDYGVDGAFAAATAAAEQGWDYAPLQAVLQGSVTEQGAWAGEAPYYADELALARLNVLERQGRTQEYLYLAEAEGQTARYATMLVKLGQGAAAVEYARQYAVADDEVLPLAQSLLAHDQANAALSIAEHGLTLHSQTPTLARWLRDTAQMLHNPEIALKAAVAAFKQTHALADYVAAEQAAGAAWGATQPELIAHLQKVDYAFERIDIYLREGMHEEAMQAVDREQYVNYDTVAKVAEAVWRTHPDWTITHCKAQAEPIMDQGKSQHYRHAARWLERAGKAYLAANRYAEWHAYLEGLIRKHARKYALRPLLEELRQLKVA